MVIGSSSLTRLTVRLSLSDSASRACGSLKGLATADKPEKKTENGAEQKAKEDTPERRWCPMGGFECLRKRNEKVMEKEELLVENDRPKEVPAGRIVTARHLRSRTGFGLNRGGKAGKNRHGMRGMDGIEGMEQSSELGTPQHRVPSMETEPSAIPCQASCSLAFKAGWKTGGGLCSTPCLHATQYKAGTSGSKRTRRLGFVPPKYAIVCSRVTLLSVPGGYEVH
ncbi:hypothetical protein MCOR02_003203 [Pyricularia oryzae]|nr:hypothetical protein MCOR02_003203 [Pyricularia oryzae]